MLFFASVFAEVLMQFTENEINSKLVNKIIFWLRYIDDIFVLVNANYINDVLAFSNSVCSEIQFTLQIE